jgi:hypothetical protein
MNSTINRDDDIVDGVVDDEDEDNDNDNGTLVSSSSRE